MYLKYFLEDITKSKVIFQNIEYNNFLNGGTISFFQISDNFLKDNIKLLNAHQEDFELKSEINKVLYGINSIFDLLNLIIGYRDSYGDFSYDLEIKKRIANHLQEEVLVSIVEEVEEIKKIRYIQKRKYSKFYILNHFKIIKSKNFKEDMLNGKLEKKEIFNILIEVKIELLKIIITSEEKEKLESRLYLEIMKKLLDLKNRLYSEKIIVREKEKIKERAKILLENIE